MHSSISQLQPKCNKRLKITSRTTISFRFAFLVEIAKDQDLHQFRLASSASPLCSSTLLIQLLVVILEAQHFPSSFVLVVLEGFEQLF
jgi:alpha-D-ribose 1-methylphosphonate 5-triphosphate synthase subunit PhnH